MKNKKVVKYKKAFSLIELIFMIVVIGIIASVAIPKLMDTRSDAVISSLKQDITTVTTSVQSYYLVHGKIDKISDAVTLNKSTWDISDKEIKFLEDTKTCVSIKIADNQLQIIIDPTAGSVCQKLSDSGLDNINYNLK